MSPRSGYFTQQCPCGSSRRPVASITLSASTLRITPRRKSRSITVYVCDKCLRRLEPRARRLFMQAIREAAMEAIADPKPQ
jgi:hypothetical protein